MMNIYHDPKKFGLEIVAELNDPFSCYDFDTVLALRDQNGRIFWCQDSGCSCPVPFEDVGVDDLSSDLDELWKFITEEWYPVQRDYNPDLVERAKADAIDFWRKVMA